MFTQIFFVQSCQQPCPIFMIYQDFLPLRVVRIKLPEYSNFKIRLFGFYSTNNSSPVQYPSSVLAIVSFCNWLSVSPPSAHAPLLYYVSVVALSQFGVGHFVQKQKLKFHGWRGIPENGVILIGPNDLFQSKSYVRQIGHIVTAVCPSPVRHPSPAHFSCTRTPPF
jgi:hypothetical protein